MPDPVFVELVGCPEAGRWKVTGRYKVQIRPERVVQCVRVRNGLSGEVKHYSEAEFKRLFREYQGD